MLNLPFLQKTMPLPVRCLPGGATVIAGGTPPSLRVRFAAMVPQPVTFAGDVDEGGVLEEPVQDGGGRRHVPDQLGPILPPTKNLNAEKARYNLGWVADEGNVDD